MKAIKYDIIKSKSSSLIECTTICPANLKNEFTGVYIKVGSEHCSNCSFLISRDLENKIVECNGC